MRKIKNSLLFFTGILLVAYLGPGQISNFRENAANNLGRLSSRGWIVETDQMHIFQKQSPAKSDWEHQWNWFGQCDPSSLQLEAGTRFGGEFVNVIARGKETIKNQRGAIRQKSRY